MGVATMHQRSAAASGPVGGRAVAASDRRTPARRSVRWVRVTLGGAWALLLALSGVHLLWEGPEHWGASLLAIGAPAWSLRLLGTGAVLAGHFVLCVLVADELFPDAHPRLVVWSQALTLAAFTLALVLSLLALSTG